MIDVGGVALLSAAARNYARSPRSRSRATTRGSSRSCARWAGLARVPPAPGRRRARRRGRLLRRGRRVPQPHRRHPLPGAAHGRGREGARPDLRREPAPGSGVLPRDDPSLELARRRGPAPGRPTRPSTTCSTWTPRTASRPTSPRRPAASSSRATRSGWPRTTRSSTPTRRRSRAIRSARSAPSSRSIVDGRGDRDGDRRQRVRGGRRARLLRRRRARSWPKSRACRCWPSPTRRPRACPTTASPTSTSTASTAGCWSRRTTARSSTTRSSRW